MIKKQNFVKIFYFLTAIFLADFILMFILQATQDEPCKDCSKYGFFIMFFGLSFFWIMAWYIVYVAFFMERYLEKDFSNMNFLKRFFLEWVKAIHKSVKDDRHLLFTASAVVFVLSIPSFVVIWAFIKILGTIFGSDNP